MNVLQGTITEVITEEGISLVSVRTGKDIFSAVVLETAASAAWLRQDHPVRLLFKETEVIISRTIGLEISVLNRLECIVKKIRSIITRNACEQLLLQAGDKIMALIKTNEVSLSSHD